MILSGFLSASIGSCTTKQHKTVSSWKPCTFSKVTSCTPHTFSKVTFSNVSCSWTQHQGLKYPNPRYGIAARSPHHLAAISSPGLFPRTTNITSPLCRHKRRSATTPPQAFLENFFNIRLRYIAMQEKPKFWWRVLACLPYLWPIHRTWMFAETAYNLHPFLESFEFMTYPFVKSIGRLPKWYFTAYIVFMHLGIAKGSIWPHFFRYHVVLGMLLEISLQVMWMTSRWSPRALYWGKIGMHFCCVFAFSFLFTGIECIRCALCGMYADVPILSNAAIAQIPYVPERPKDL